MRCLDQTITPSLAANRLARWALMLSQFDYQNEYRRTKDHGNADVRSHLSTSGDTSFGGEEKEEDIQIVCNIEEVSKKIAPTDQNPLSRESAKDPTISSVIRHTREGWPPKGKEEQGCTSVVVRSSEPTSNRQGRVDPKIRSSFRRVLFYP